ncbi:hypothetical protein LY90DRAFT_697594 [Neocallimastix californiae]|jgi:gamma-glutamylcyclotransferase (GGCT)/AIG2-like uncharacterized protein YtfP|uniref:N-acetyltransferase domain-containing protein n=1 Tax=Neocallimastix californiae TaxID=1754190 RepID=A0A1Y2FEB2_9FUNG|nr:hypothetical protein LY90DRAFT_697594 [Neocallimastix californiae]|eukprot:ORY82278.1 hypothetical protein LY90DRAFT_697594 [Neocallimastix californiae]
MSKENPDVSLVPLQPEDREQFITDNQEAFNYGALEEFGKRDDHLNNEGQIISRKTIERSIDHPHSETYRILYKDQKVGGVVIRIDKETLRGELELLFTSPKIHNKGCGYTAWCLIERLHPEIKVWETITPYFEKRNIHFYVNRCGFHIVEFINEFHQAKYSPEEEEMFEEEPHEGPEEMFRFEKIMHN